MKDDSFCRTRPYAFHLTAPENLSRIARTGRLDTAEALCRLAGCADLMLARRDASVGIQVEEDRVVIRDQLPLHVKRMDLQGRPFEALLADLNHRVFFWAGSERGPGRYGDSHLKRYKAEESVMLRVPMRDLLRKAEPELCRYNSGSPRHSGGQPSPRGPFTFVPLSAWADRPSMVVEVTFVGGIALPATTQWANAHMKTWHGLFTSEEQAQAPSNKEMQRTSATQATDTRRRSRRWADHTRS